MIGEMNIIEYTSHEVMINNNKYAMLQAELKTFTQYSLWTRFNISKRSCALSCFYLFALSKVNHFKGNRYSNS